MYKAKKPIYDINHPEIEVAIGGYVEIEDVERAKQAIALGLIEETTDKPKEFAKFVKEVKEEVKKATPRRTTKK